MKKECDCKVVVWKENWNISEDRLPRLLGVRTTIQMICRQEYSHPSAITLDNKWQGRNYAREKRKTSYKYEFSPSCKITSNVISNSKLESRLGYQNKQWITLWSIITNRNNGSGGVI